MNQASTTTTTTAISFQYQIPAVAAEAHSTTPSLGMAISSPQQQQPQSQHQPSTTVMMSSNGSAVTMSQAQYQAMINQHQPPNLQPIQQQPQPPSLPDEVKEEIKQEPMEDIGTPPLVASTQQQQEVMLHGGSEAVIKTEEDDPKDSKPSILIYQPQMPVSTRMGARISHLGHHTLYIPVAGRIVVGRNSTRATVNYHIGKNNFISRKHYRIRHCRNNNELYIKVTSKNGIFVNEKFFPPLKEEELLPNICHLRFPSTEIRLMLELLDGLDGKPPAYFLDAPPPPLNGVTMASTSGVNASMYAPLNIKIPKKEKSPPLSPTGTLSAANSCPTSPRQNYRDYHSTSYSNNSHNVVAATSSSSTIQSGSYNNNNGFNSPPA